MLATPISHNPLGQFSAICYARTHPSAIQFVREMLTESSLSHRPTLGRAHKYASFLGQVTHYATPGIHYSWFLQLSSLLLAELDVSEEKRMV
jgi:hypothetical protein